MAGADLALAMWRLEPALLASLCVAAVFYLRGWRILTRILPHRFPTWRAGCFLAGLLAVWVAVASPLDSLAGFLLQAHMVQHMVLTMLAPPLILAGAPYLPILRGLPRAWSRGIAAPVLTAPAVSALGCFFTHPAVAWILFVGSNVLWHIPTFYDAALRSESIHALEHACFLGTGFLFWWFVVQPWPSRRRWPEWASIPYLLLADFQNTALAAILTFVDHPLYPAYEEVPRLWGISALVDQNAAGLIMWIPGSVGFLVPAGWIAIRLLSPRRGVRPSEFARKNAPSPPAKKISRRPSRVNVLHLRTVLRTSLLALAIVIVWDGLFGPPISSMNLAGVLPWTFWRGFAVVALLLAGNIVCTGCPFMLVRDGLRNVFPPPTHNWPAALRNKWTAVGLLVLFFWAYEVFALWDRPAVTAWIIIGYFAAAAGTDLVFRGASFCKWICPIGQYHYAMAASGAAEVRIKNPDACTTCRTYDCLRGNDSQRGCELHLFQPKKQGAFDCTGCMDCVAACPVGNVGIGSVVPAADLGDARRRSSIGEYEKRGDLAALVALFVAAAVVNAAAMTAPVQNALPRIAEGSGIPLVIIVSLLLLGGMGGLSLLLLATGRRAVFAYVPLGASLWAAHFLFHLITGFWTFIPVSQRFLRDLGLFSGEPDWSVVGFSGDWVLAIELTLIDLGWLATLILLWRLAPRRRFLWWAPRAVLATLGFLLAVWILFQPMEMRGTSLAVG